MRQASDPGLWRGLGVIVVAVILAGPRPVAGQGATDPVTGEITGVQFLALGPFANPFGCSGVDADLLGNHIAPSIIACEYPEAGDEVEYDPELAASTGYNFLAPVGPNQFPIWRAWDDGTPLDGEQSMEADTLTGPLDDHNTFLLTYIAYMPEDDQSTFVDICARSDDGVQVWWDDQLAINRNACRGMGQPGTCGDTAYDVEVTPGLHRLIISAWDRGGYWGCAVRLIDSVTQVTVQDGDPDWEFLGVDSGGLPIPECFPPQQPVTLDPCEWTCDGVELVWEHPETNNLTGMITVFVNDIPISTIDGEDTSFQIEPEHLVGANVTICVDNGGLSNACCTVTTPGEIAKSGVPAQTSTHGSFTADLAIDGNLDSFTHTLAGVSTPATWALDLGDWVPIVGVVLHNRRNCCGSRLRDITVEILGQNGVDVLYQSELLNPENVLGAFPAGPPSLEVTLEDLGGAPVEGRYVRVRRTPDPDLSGTGGQGNNDEADVLSLAEVSVLADVCGSQPPPERRFVRGDSDSDGMITITDGVVTLAHLYQGGPAPLCLDAADFDDSGDLAVTDAVALFAWMFQSGANAPPPTPSDVAYLAADCGSDPTDTDPLECKTESSTCK